MLPQPLLVYGAGGHAGVIIDIIKNCHHYTILGIIDDDPTKKGRIFWGCPVLGGIQIALDKAAQGIPFVLAVGDNEARKSLAERLEGFSFVTFVHPSATVAQGVQLGKGTVVMAHAVVNPGASIGRHVIINTGATVDHECIVGDFAHLSPGVHLGGRVTVGAMTHIGIGASVINDIKVGDNSIIGAGAAVVQDIPSNVVGVGVPCRVLRTRE